VALQQQRLGSEDLLVYPAQKSPVELIELLPRYVGQDGSSLALVHEIPHGGNRLYAAPLVGYLSVVGDEVKFASAMAQAALLDFMGAHRKARLGT